MRIAIVTACLAVLLTGCDKPFPYYTTDAQVKASEEQEKQAKHEEDWLVYEDTYCIFPFDTKVRITDGFYKGQMGVVKRQDSPVLYVVQLKDQLYSSGPIIKDVPISAMEPVTDAEWSRYWMGE